MCAMWLVAAGVSSTEGKENEHVGGKMRYISSSSSGLIHILCFVGRWTQLSPGFILHNNQAPHEWEASRQDLILPVRTVCNAWSCFGTSYHFCRSDLMHHGENWVVLKLSQLCNHPTWPQTPSGEKEDATDVIGLRVHQCLLCKISMFSLTWV
jgi:hypothetical protein